MLRWWKKLIVTTADAELAAKLDYEKSLEESETKNPAALPQELQDYLGDSQFKIADQPGTENIVLTKSFGNETYVWKAQSIKLWTFLLINTSIRIEVSISDVNDQAESSALEDDDLALDDEPDFNTDNTSGGKRTINQSGVKGGKIDIAPEDSIAPSDRDAGEDAADEPGSFPINLSVTIDKGAIGATNVIATAQDGQLEVEYIHFYPRADLIDPKTAEAAKEAQNVYGGPPFQYLDAELQQMYETYLQERGINEQLFWFLGRYAEYKEQREYVQWLDSKCNMLASISSANTFHRHEEIRWLLNL